MKKIIKLIGLVALIGFSFFYTDKVIQVIREEDEIMIAIESTKDTYETEAIDASISGNTIIPGINGKTVNVNESYKSMKSYGIFNSGYLVYDEVKPDISITSNKDKFIIMGNSNKQMVSLVFILDSDKYLNKVEEILNSKGVIANYFIDYNYLVRNSTIVKEMEDREFYSYGDEGTYSPDNLLFSNNLISRISNNEAIYCLTSEMDEDILTLCSKNELYTIVPNIIGGDNPYSAVKENVSSGSIILLSMNSDTANELSIIIDYIKGKGLKIGGLSNLLTESLN